METRANYILIGAFTVGGFVGLLGFFLWFANLQFDRQFAYYDIDFPSVSGLAEASDVRFAGFPVGQVVDVGLSPEGDGRIRVRIEIAAETPVRADSVATIEAQGVTGVSFVGLTAGTPDTPLLGTGDGDAVPMIEAGQSVLQSLSSDAPQIVSETLALVRDLRDILGGENQARIDAILGNVERASAAFTVALDDFSDVSGSVSGFAQQLDRFNASLETFLVDASGAIETVETTLASVDALSQEARTALAAGRGTINRADGVLERAELYVSEDLSPATARLDRTLAQIETRFAALSAEASALMATYAEAGAAARDRLTEARETLEATNQLIARLESTAVTVDGAASRFDTLLEEDAGPMIADIRGATEQAAGAIDRIGRVAEADLPVIVADIRTATARASEVIETVGTDLSRASGRLDGLAANAGTTLDAARRTFADANDTLAAINAALETGDRALAAAERAFEGAERVLDEDVAVITADLRATLERLQGAVGRVVDDIPAVTESLRTASASAEAAFDQISTTVRSSAPALQDFAATDLPQFGRLAAETRQLIDNLDALLAQIRRDPSRFLLEPRAPEFRR